jgi:nucleotide-binding universal stress UspA family protein
MDGINMKRIVCPVDFSPSSDYALGYALDLARMFEAQLTLLHVVEVPFLPSYAMAGVPDLNIPLEQIEDGARKGLERLAGECRPKYGRVGTELRTGTAFMEIIAYAREHEVDMIVMGTHGRTGLSHLLIGSVAEKVVRKSPCPVLTIRHPEHRFEMP